jgi:hypothetical protein
MKLMDKTSCIEWCVDRRIQTSGNTRISFLQDDGEKAIVSIPAIFLECVSLSFKLEAVFNESSNGSLFWMRDWGMWSEKIETLGMVYWKRLRPDIGTDTLCDRPGHLFSPNDGEILRGLLLLPMIFQWDALWIADSGNLIVNIKHDGIIEVFVCGESAVNRILEIKALISK